MLRKLLFISCVIFLMSFNSIAQTTPLKVGVIGLTHTHVHWILGRENIGDIEIVGIVESNPELAQRYADQHGYSMNIVFNTMAEMIAAKKPEAVTAFGTIYEHLEVVEFCAPKGIHVMVEKPLAVSMEHANKMAALAKKHNIHLLTNYETTWYPSNHKLKELLDQGKIVDMRKVIVNDGHKGPKKIGVNSEFLDWLTDPVQNGGGAITDFGCYGANLMTWLQEGKRPISVTADGLTFVLIPTHGSGCVTSEGTGGAGVNTCYVVATWDPIAETFRSKGGEIAINPRDT
jgi:predicted dehydrogenase